MGCSKPLLSICIPTYNRANLLESALFALVPQIRMFENIVELIVSDNCSTDNTEQVVKKIQELIPIRYYRNAQNEGFGCNIFHLTDELAEGEFAWLLGDDDLVRPDGVKKLLDVLNSHHEIDYVFMNVTCKEPKERPKLDSIESVSILDSFDLLPAKAKNLEDRYIEKWEELIDPEIDDVFLGAMMCSVFRLSIWRNYRLELNMNDEILSSLENSYPHVVKLANTMMGRKSYYIGYPAIITFFGEQKWIGYVPMIYLVRLQEILDLYLRLGVDIKQVEKCRYFLLSSSSKELQAMIFDPNALGRKYFSLFKFIQRNRYHKGKLIYLFTFILLNRLPKPIQQILRFVKKNIFRFSHK
jgi:glycosyltransferase involved in cell wall biosynthesis